MYMYVLSLELDVIFGIILDEIKCGHLLHLCFSMNNHNYNYKSTVLAYISYMYINASLQSLLRKNITLFIQSL